jgi:hypothetical protein
MKLQELQIEHKLVIKTLTINQILYRPIKGGFIIDVDDANISTTCYPITQIRPMNYGFRPTLFDFSRK